MKKAILLLSLSLSLVAFGPFQPAVAEEYALVAPQSQQVLICESSSSYAYHAYKCSGLSRCTHSISKLSLQEAQNLGRKPCKICYK